MFKYMYSICMQFSKKLMHHCLEVYKYMQTNPFLMIRTRNIQYLPGSIAPMTPRHLLHSSFTSSVASLKALRI